MKNKFKPFLSILADLIWLGTSHFGRMRNKEYVYIFKYKLLNILATYFIVLIIFIMYIVFSLLIQNAFNKLGILSKNGIEGFYSYWYFWIIYFLIYIISLEEITRKIDKRLNKKSSHF